MWWLHLAQDQFCTTWWVRVGPGGGVVVSRTPVRPNSDSAELLALVVLDYSCCGVRIELAVGSFPYQGDRLEKSEACSISLEEGISLALTALDVKESPSRETHFPSYEGIHSKKLKMLTLSNPVNGELSEMSTENGQTAPIPWMAFTLPAGITSHSFSNDVITDSRNNFGGS